MNNLLLLLCLIAFIQPTVAQIKCTLKGTVVGRPESKALRLYKRGESFRTTETIKINIENGEFSYDLEAPYSEIYVLAFEDELQEGSWTPIKFHAADGIVDFKLHPSDDFHKNVIVGGEENEIIMANYARSHIVNKKYDEVYNISDKLTEEQTYSEKGLELRAKLDTISGIARNELFTEMDRLRKSGELYTAEYNVFRKRIDSISMVFYSEEAKYNRENPSLIAYSDLVSDLSTFKYFVEDYEEEGTPLDNVIKRYDLFSRAYPNHIYTERCKVLIESARAIRIGGTYVDFSAPDLGGDIITLSSKIKGKIAIIDLWASWCGSCRVASKSYIPVYNEFKDRGFTIVGVAREKGDDKRMRIAIEKDGYTWTNLLELNDKNKIWEKYGIGNAGGCSFMVDEKGVILAIRPTAEEVRKILLERLD